MVAAAKKFARSAALGWRSGAMPANVIEPAQLAIESANKQQRLANQLGREEISRMRDLAGMPDDLPGAGKDLFFFRGADRRVKVKMSGQSPGARNVRINMEFGFGDRHRSSSQVAGG